MLKDEKTGLFKQTHGIKAFEDRGPKALAPVRQEYLKELKARLATDEGRKEYRVELAAAIALICELGFGELRKSVENGQSIFETPVVKILGAYQNALQRMLFNWPKDEEKPQNILDALKGEGDE